MENNGISAKEEFYCRNLLPDTASYAHRPSWAGLSVPTCVQSSWGTRALPALRRWRKDGV